MKTNRNAVRLLLPPASASLARARREELSQLLSCALSALVQVDTAANYEQLHRQVISGEADVVWAPPMVCARFETTDVRVLMRAVRDGDATYRAALVCSAGTGGVPVESLSGTRAAWVDAESCAGYLLPTAWLRERGVTMEENFVGSYQRALQLVINGEADVSSVYCSGVPDFERLIPGSTRRLHVVGLTDEVPNDGIVVGPYAPRELSQDLELVLQHPESFPDGRRVLAGVFGTNAFEAAPRHGYRALYSLLSGRAERAVG